MFTYPKLEKNTKEFSNRTVLLELIKNYFSIQQESLEYIEKELFEPTVDNFYHDIIGDNLDLRKSWSLNNVMDYDEGWALFKNIFINFHYDVLITYKEFHESRITINKNVIKLKNYLIDYYTKNEIKAKSDLLDYREFDREEVIKKIDENLNRIGAVKLSKKNEGPRIVLSLNPVDMFLASTGNGWNSCISLDSDYEKGYWTGLPGIFGDKNRCIVYLTDGSQKDVYGMTAEKQKSRSWGILNNEEKIILLRWYPSQKISINSINSVIGSNYFEKTTEDTCWSSKNSIIPIFHKNGNSSFIYQDGSHIENINKKFFITQGFGGHTFINDKLEVAEGDLFDFGNKPQLTEIINANTTIEEYSETLNLYTCDDCGEKVEEEYIYRLEDGRFVCDNCLESYYVLCESCNEYFIQGDIIEVGKYSEPYCINCIEGNAEKSEWDGNYYFFDDLVTVIDNGKEILVSKKEAINKNFVLTEVDAYYAYYPENEVVKINGIGYYPIKLLEDIGYGICSYDNQVYNLEDMEFIKNDLVFSENKNSYLNQINDKEQYKFNFLDKKT